MAVADAEAADLDRTVSLIAARQVGHRARINRGGDGQRLEGRAEFVNAIRGAVEDIGRPGSARGVGIEFGQARHRHHFAGIDIQHDARRGAGAFAQPLAVGSYRLALDYTGRIGTQANGLFAIDYDTPAGKKRALYTQFENSDARRLIPSWDEPSLKATFHLAVTAPAAWP